MYFVWGFTGAYTLHDPTPRAPVASLTPPQRIVGAPKNSIPLVGPVMTYPTFHAPETPFGPHFNTFLARVETCGHRASYEMHDVHDVHSLVVIIILCVLYQPGTQVQRSATYTSTTVAALLHPYPYCVY